MFYRVPGRLLSFVVVAVAATLSVPLSGAPPQTLDDVLERAAAAAAAFADSTLRVVCQETDRQTIVVDPVPLALSGEPAHNPTGWAARDVLVGWSVAPPSRDTSEGWRELRKVQSSSRFTSFPGKDPVTSRTTALVDAADEPAPFPRFAVTLLSTSNQQRFEFSKAGETEVDGVAVWEVTFRETATPPAWVLPLSGSLWIDASTGRLVKSTAVVKGRDAFADAMTIDYRVDPASGLNLPHRLTRRTDLNHFKHERLWVETTGTFMACRRVPVATN